MTEIDKVKSTLRRDLPDSVDVWDFVRTEMVLAILEKIAPQINSDKVVNPEAFLKIIKPLCISVENTLPMLMECQDNLEYLKDDNSFVLRQKIAHIEDDLLPPIIEYIRAHDKKD